MTTTNKKKTNINTTKERKDQIADCNRIRQQLARDIGTISPPKDQKRRDKCKNNLLKFIQTYFYKDFYLPMSKDHLADIKLFETCIKNKQLMAIAAPRSYGKTTLCLAACIWSILYGKSKFLVIVAADQSNANRILNNLKTELETNELLEEDFNEVIKPIKALDGTPQKAIRQTYNHEKTFIVYSKDIIQFPTTKTEHSLCDGSIIMSKGITSQLRGINKKLPSGITVRPDLFILDDPQSSETAKSKQQTDDRLATIKGTIEGMASANTLLSGFALVTVIQKGDLADQLIDRKLNPRWQGIKRKLLYKFPSNMKLWEEYNDIRNDGLINGDGGKAGTEFYKANFDSMNEGALVGWEHRKTPEDLTALQYCMNKFFYDQRSFFAEYQNEPPEDATNTNDLKDALKSDNLNTKLNNLERFIIPSGSQSLYAFADVNKNMITYIVCAFRKDLKTDVVDYGQIKNFDDAKRTPQENIWIGLTLLTKKLFEENKYYIDGTDTDLRVEKLGIDSGYMTLPIYNFCKNSIYHSSLVPTKGEGSISKIKYDKKNILAKSEGYIYALTAQGKTIVKLVRYDANYNKTLLAQRLNIIGGVSGSISFFGSNPVTHTTLFNQLNSETPIKQTLNGVEFVNWKLKTGVQNHYFDCLNCVNILAQLFGGCKMETNFSNKIQETTPPEPQKPTIKQDLPQQPIQQPPPMAKPQETPLNNVQQPKKPRIVRPTYTDINNNNDWR